MCNIIALTIIKIIMKHIICQLLLMLMCSLSCSGLLSFISWVLSCWVLISIRMAMYRIIHIMIIAESTTYYMTWSTNTHILSLNFAWGCYLEVVVWIFLRRDVWLWVLNIILLLLLLMRFLLVSSCILRPDVFIKSTYCLMLGVIFLLADMTRLLLDLLFYWSNNGVGILIITHDSPRGLWWSSFCTLLE